MKIVAKTLFCLLIMVLYTCQNNAFAGEQYAKQDTFIHASVKPADENRACFLRKGTPVRIRGAMGEMCMVEYTSDGVSCTGYVAADALSDATVAPDATEVPEPTHKTTRPVIVSQKPSMLGKKLAHFNEYGIGVTILKEDGNFSRIRWVSKDGAEIRGWVKTEILVTAAEYEEVKDRLKAEALARKKAAVVSAARAQAARNARKAASGSVTSSKGSTTPSEIRRKVLALSKKNTKIVCGQNPARNAYFKSLKGMTLTGTVRVVSVGGYKEDRGAKPDYGQIHCCADGKPRVGITGRTDFKHYQRKGQYKGRIKATICNGGGGTNGIRLSVTFHEVGGVKKVSE